MDFDYWNIFLTIVAPILTIWYCLRRANGQFDGGGLNENDMEYYEDSEKYGPEIAGIKDTFRAGKKFFKK